MKYLTYTENLRNHSFSDFIQSFGYWQNRNQIILHPSIGVGSIRCIDMEPGLQLRLWDCTFNEDTEILRIENNDVHNRTFTVIYYLTPDSFKLEEFKDSLKKVDPIWNSVLVSSDALFKATLLANKPIQCMSINFSTDWVQKHVLCDLPSNNSLINKFALQSEPFTIFESLSALERKATESFFEIHTQHLFGKFFWRSKTLHLLTELFSKIVNRLSIYHGVDSFHEQRMAEVEKELVENVYNGLPDIKMLAQKIAVSESTLKRYFRRIYGKNIYNYYLEKRMTCAKALLADNKKTVTETAYIMGYENVSHFCSMFKRFFGLQPGAFKKMEMQQK